eukprot:TRINITY_DN1979_c0_g1_i9.p2 TRINITY_DN1979_c0_g1~~TRINITY_DN1979_c0_g1_i9.p2  ORF type:complete len:135 (-),score=50.75 TRINITY_DN1979_c0_g1_i9:91-495(-)
MCIRQSDRVSNYFFFFQAEDGIRDAQESRGLGDVYKRQVVSTQSTWGIIKIKIYQMKAIYLLLAILLIGANCLNIRKNEGGNIEAPGLAQKSTKSRSIDCFQTLSECIDYQILMGQPEDCYLSTQNGQPVYCPV